MIPRPPRALVRFERIFAAAYFPIFHRVEFRGRGTWPETGPLIVTSNHPCYWDPWLVGMGMKRYVYWMAWEAIFGWPLVGRLVRAHEAFPVDLEKPKPSTLRRARELLAAGEALGVFPEGERTSGKHGPVDPFKPGLAWLAFATGAPILPVSISGGRRVWPKQRAYPVPGKLIVTYHALIRPEEVLVSGSRREREAELTRVLERTVASAAL